LFELPTIFTTPQLDHGDFLLIVTKFWATFFPRILSNTAGPSRGKQEFKPPVGSWK
jgi:hypothetical protein